VKPLLPFGINARARHRHFLFPVPNFYTELPTYFFGYKRAPPRLFPRVLSASRPLLRARLCKCRRASAVVRWAPSFGEVVCDENGIGGGGECCGRRLASGGKNVPCAVLFDLRCARVVARRAITPGKPREQKFGRGQQLGQGPLQKEWGRIMMIPPL
jgi:hypothetical protein